MHEKYWNNTRRMLRYHESGDVRVDWCQRGSIYGINAPSAVVITTGDVSDGSDFDVLQVAVYCVGGLGTTVEGLFDDI